MITRIVRSVLEGYGINQKMVDKLKSVVDNIDVREVDEEVWIEVELKKVKIVIQKDKPEEGE